MERRLRRVLGGLLLGGLLLVVYFSVVGIGEVRRALWVVPPRRLLSLLIVGGVSLLFWGLGLHLVFDRLDISVGPTTSILLFTAAGFFNGITPFGQAGGDPVAAVLFRRALGTDFETGLAAIGSVNALNRVAAVFLGLLGVGYLGSRVAAGGNLRTAALVVTGLSVVVALGLMAAWQSRYRLVGRIAAGLTPLARAGARVVPGVRPSSRAALERRGRRFIAAIDRLAADPRRLALVFGLSVAGHLAVASTLWVALAGLGFDVSVAVVLLVIPLAKLAGLAPTPGGFGSAETMLATLLLSTTTVDAPVAGAAVLLYRASAFWLPSLVGGLVAGWFVVTGNAGGTGAASPGATLRGGGRPNSSTDDESHVPVSRSTLPRILLAVTVTLAVTTVVVIHRSRLLVEPDSIVVHAVRDTAVVLVSFVLTWFLLRRLPRRWLG
ncbi:YbhN family protein [Salinigranum sp.]|uniref:lysylphosphatidylglycerol synthase transmembrane domain-containing protein n=1 Tax=Salinigranum sp. TaxID=1966351 RepID=UPI00356B4F7F